MYKLSFFTEKDLSVVLEFIHQHPFAFVAGADEKGRPVATQLPVFMEEREGKLYLSGHMMRNTDHHAALEVNPQVLFVFTGAHSYVSATWYKDPHQASTWNYMSVHVRGLMKFLGEDELVAVLKKTSLHFEGGNTASPTSYDNLPDNYRSRLLTAIVAFEVEVEEMDSVFKLSQNRDKESYETIIQNLSEGDADAAAVADEMRKREVGLFTKKEAL